MTEGSIDRRWRRLKGEEYLAVVDYPPGFADVCLEELSAGISQTSTKCNASAHLVERQLEIRNITPRHLAEVAAKVRSATNFTLIFAQGKCDTFAKLKSLCTRTHIAELFEVAPDISVTSKRSRLRHRAAISKMLLEAMGLEAAEAKPQLEVSFVDDVCQVRVPLFSEKCYKRNYKEVMGGLATMREDSAAAAWRWFFTIFADAHATSDFFIPFAGSGTLGFEGVLARHQVLPYLWRDEEPLSKTRLAPQQTWRWLKQNAPRTAKSIVSFVESDKRADQLLRASCHKFATQIPAVTFEVHHADFLDMKAFTSRSALVGLNPPWGERLEDTDGLYAAIGKLLRTASVPGGIIFCPSQAHLRAFQQGLGKANFKEKPVKLGGISIALLGFMR